MTKARIGGNVLLIGLIALFGTAHAASSDADRSRIVALQIDGATRTIINATADALYASRDEGRTWKRLPLPPLAAGARIGAVAVGASAEKKRAWYVAGAGLGVLRSENEGRTWTARNAGLPTRDVTALAAHAINNQTVYAYIAGRGVFRSENGGLKWKLMDGGPRESIVQLVHSNLAGSMQTGWLIAATGKGVRRAMDCFCGWRDAGALENPLSSVTFDPRAPERVYAASADALFVSKNGGEQWERMKAPAAGISALAAAPGQLYAAGADGALFVSGDGGATWKRVDA